jgi:hypothetical protein
MALAHCILGKFVGVGCRCFPPPLDVPTFSTRCCHVQQHERPLAAEGETLRGREMFRQIVSRIRLPSNSRDLLHAANLRHGTPGFTSPPKEGVLRIFSPLKIRWLRPGLNPRTWVPMASTLPLDHRSRYIYMQSATHALLLITSSSCQTQPLHHNAHIPVSPLHKHINHPFIKIIKSIRNIMMGYLFQLFIFWFPVTWYSISTRNSMTVCDERCLCILSFWFIFIYYLFIIHITFTFNRCTTDTLSASHSSTVQIIC